MEEKCNYVGEVYGYLNYREDLFIGMIESEVFIFVSYKFLYKLIKFRNEVCKFEFLGDVYGDDIDLESVGSCEGVVLILNKVLFLGVGINLWM